MSRAETITPSLRQMVREAEAALRRAGVASARYDAERLAAHALGTNWGGLWARMDEPVSVERFRSLVARRAGGEPLAYIEGSTVFCGLEISCGPGVLVPRPETEVLVEVALDLVGQHPRPVIVDVGTGSGAVAVAVAMGCPRARVLATDISPTALAYARGNAEACGAEVEFLEGDLLEPLPADLRGSVDVVVSNPPYVAEGTHLPADVRAEPAGAIFAGPRGDEVIQRLVAHAGTWLRRQGGALAFEIGESWQAASLPDSSVRADLLGRPRVVWRRW